MKWASWVNVVLGLWLIVAPFALAYSDVTAALYEDVILGVIVAALALWSALAEQTRVTMSVRWVTAVAGLWVFVAPFVLAYTDTVRAMASDLVVGFVVLVLSVWEALAVRTAMTAGAPSTKEKAAA